MVNKKYLAGELLQTGRGPIKLPYTLLNCTKFAESIKVPSKSLQNLQTGKARASDLVTFSDILTFDSEDCQKIQRNAI